VVVTEVGAPVIVVVVPVVMGVPWEVRCMSDERPEPMLRARARSSPAVALPGRGLDPMLGGRPTGRVS